MPTEIKKTGAVQNPIYIKVQHWQQASFEITLRVSEVFEGVVRSVATGATTTIEVKAPFTHRSLCYLKDPSKIIQDNFYSRVIHSNHVPSRIELHPRGLGGMKKNSPVSLSGNTSLSTVPKTPKELVAVMGQLGAKDPRRSLYLAAAKQFVKEFASNPTRSKDQISGFVMLVLLEDRDITRAVIGLLIDTIKNSTLLDLNLVEALADAIDRAVPSDLNSDDLVQLMLTIVERIKNTHSAETKSLEDQLKALARILNAMVDANVCDIPRVKQDEIKACLRDFSDSSSFFVQCLAAYSEQALIRVPNDETKFAAFLRHSTGLVKGVYHFYAAIHKLDPEHLVQGFFAIQETVKGIVAFATELAQTAQNALPDLQDALTNAKEVYTPRNLHWYEQVRYLEWLIAADTFCALAYFLSDPRLKKEPFFIYLLVENLHATILFHQDLQVKREALFFLKYIYLDDFSWGNRVLTEDHFKNEGPTTFELLNRGEIRGRIQVKMAILSALQSYTKIPDLKIDAITILQSITDRIIPDTEQFRFVERSLQRLRSAVTTTTSTATLFATNPEESFKMEAKLEKIKAYLIEDESFNLEKPLYVPLRGSPFQGSPLHLDLMEELQNFLKSDQRVLLLLGDSGSGKSFFSQILAAQLWGRYQPLVGTIPLYISLPSVKNPTEELIYQALKRFGVTPDEVNELKNHREVIFILDGYDEIPKNSDILERNELLDFKGKIIVTCRSESLPSRELFVPTFNGKPKRSLLRELHLVPFSTSQIDHLLKNCIALGNTEWKEVALYRRHIDEVPGLQDLVQNPFILKIITDTLPEIIDRMKYSAANEQVSLTRNALYQVFMEEWFQKGFMRAKKQFNQLQPLGLEPGNLVSEATKFCTDLAMLFQSKGLTHVQYDPSRDPAWEPFLGMQPRSVHLRSMAPLKVTNDRIYSFLHKSLLEYFLALGSKNLIGHIQRISKKEENIDFSALKAPVLAQPIPVKHVLTLPKTIDLPALETPDSSQPDWINHPPALQENMDFSTQKRPGFISEPTVEAPVAANVKGLPIFESLLDPSVWFFLADSVKEDPSFKQELFSIIERSKTDPKVALGAANAISILNLANISFAGRDFQGIRIPGAHLERANLTGTDLRSADLTNANLTNALLNDAQLDKAQMGGVKFGQFPMILAGTGVHALVYSPRRDLLIMAGGDGTVHIWDQKSATKIKKLESDKTKKERGEWITALALLDSGKKLAAPGDNNTICIWDLESWTECKKLEGHQSNVKALLSLNEGRKLISRSDDGAIIVWDWNIGRKLKKFEGHTGMCDLALLDHENKLASGNTDGTINIWNLDLGSKWKTLKEHTGAVKTLVALDGGKKLISGSMDNTILVWDLTSGSKPTKLEGHTAGVFALALLDNEKTLISAGADHCILIWDLDSATLLKKLEGHTGRIDSLLVLEGGKKLASGSWDRTVRIWDLESVKELKKTEGHLRQISSAVFLEHANKLISGSYDGSARVWDTKSGGELKTIRTGGNVYSLELLGGGRKLASGGNASAICIWDVNSGKLLQKLYGHSKEILALSFFEGEKGGRLISASNDGTFCLWNPETAQLLKKIECQSLKRMTSHQPLTFFDQGKKFVTAHETSNCITLYNSETGKWIHEIKHPATTFTLFEEEQKLASGDKKGTIKIWDLGSYEELRKLIGHTDEITALAALEKGGKLASASLDKTIRIWNVASGKELFQMTYPFSIKSLKLEHPDLLVAGDIRGGLSCWKLNVQGAMVKTTLLWTTYPFFMCSDVKIDDILNLSATNQRLMLQHGAQYISRSQDQLQLQYGTEYLRLKEKAEEGDAVAQYHFGLLFKNGEGIPQSNPDAMKWFHMSAEQGHVQAQYELALLYAEGKGVRQSDNEAVKWCRKAADRGHSSAQCKLGDMYQHGKGVTASMDEALKWYRKAAGQGDSNGEYSIGMMYILGNKPSYTEAEKWLKKAAEKGNGTAQLGLKTLDSLSKNGFFKLK